MITAAVAGAIMCAVHLAFRRSRLRTWMDLDEHDDRLGRLGEPRDDAGNECGDAELDDRGEDDEGAELDHHARVRHHDDVLAPAGSAGICVVDE